MDKKFDPNFHEALSMVKNPAKKNNTVGHIISEGYMINESILRAAKVIVIKNWWLVFVYILHIL